MKRSKRARKTAIVISFLLTIILIIAGWLILRPSSPWQHYTLPSEKLSVSYPANWQVHYISYPTNGQTNRPQDYVEIIAPSHLKVSIFTGQFWTGKVSYEPGVQFGIAKTEPISTLGGSYQLVYLTMNGALNRIYVARSPNPTINHASNPLPTDNDYPLDRHITVTNPAQVLTHRVYTEIDIGYKYYNEDAQETPPPLSTYLHDPYFTTAKQIISTIHY